MDTWLAIGSGIGMFVILPYGMSHLFLNEKDKAELATKSDAYRGFIQFCRIGTIIFMLVAVLILVGQCMGRSGGGGDCEYGRTGRYCS